MSGLRPFIAIPQTLREWTKWAKEAIVDESVGTSQLEDNSVTVAKLAQLSANSILANATNSTANVAALAAASNDTLLRRSSDALSFGQLTAAMFPSAIVPDAALSANVPLISSGSYTGTLTGCTTSPTANVGWIKVGPLVILTLPTLLAVSNTNACTITGPAPASIRPVTQQQVITRVQDNSVTAVGVMLMDSTGLITLSATVATAAFTAANNKGSVVGTICYGLL